MNLSQIPIPEFIDIWYLDKEADPSDRTAIESVIDTVRPRPRTWRTAAPCAFR